MNFLEFEVFYKSIFIGFFLVIPIGPIALLMINRTISNGSVSGFASAVGVSLADALYAGIAALGLTLVSHFLTTYSTGIRIVTAIIICILGLRILLSKPINHTIQITPQDVIKDIVSIFLLTLANPLTLFAFMSALAVFNIQSSTNSPVMLVACGVGLGSFIWWTILIHVVKSFHTRIPAQKIRLFSIFSGIVIMVFGLAIIGELVLTIAR